jgi:hypothetical protein
LLRAYVLLYPLRHIRFIVLYPVAAEARHVN